MPLSKPLFIVIALSTFCATGLPMTTALNAAGCNPEDCGGLSREELARDRAEIRRLNREQLRYVQNRDAEYARGWEAQQTHAQAIEEYERRMAEWREAVRRCRAGERRYCSE